MGCPIPREGRQWGQRTDVHAAAAEAAKKVKDEGREGDRWISTPWGTGTLEGM